VESFDKHPDSLPYDVQEVHSQHEENSQKILIILASDTVIQVLAMMIKVKRTPVAPHTMVAFQEYAAVAYHAFLDILMLLSIDFCGLIDQGVNRVHEGEVDIIVAEEQYKGIIKR
jgi:hypothetical protein